MKFGKQYERARDSQFAKYYIDFTTLKKSLKGTSAEDWAILCQEQMNRSEQFYSEQIERARSRFVELRSITAEEHGDFMHVHSQNQIAAIIKILRRLLDFLTLNSLALKKIRKKAKKTYTHPPLPQELLDSQLLGHDRDAKLLVHEEMIRQMLQCLTPAAVGLNEILLMSAPREAKVTQWVWFLSGINLTLLVVILFLIFVLPWSQEKHMTDFLALLKPFRFVMMIIFFLVGAGMALETFEKYNVNWRYLFQIEPTCIIKAQDVHRVAVILSTTVLLILILFITDLKFTGFTSRENRVILYPALLTLLVAGIIVGPSAIIRRKYRATLAHVAFLCMIAPFGGSVRFCDNIMGDVLTSIAKPLQDLMWTMCFLSRYAIEGVSVLDDTTQICGQHTTNILVIMALLPYYFRLMQCVSRYRETKENIHLANCGKYITGLAMVIITTINWTSFGLTIYSARLLVVIAYCAATIYMYLWDLRMDWGLIDVESGKIIARYSMYPRSFYYTITAFNTLGRMMWGITMIPISLEYPAQTEAVFFFVSAIEIMRRSLWIFLRVERHHVLNIEEGNIITSAGVHEAHSTSPMSVRIDLQPDSPKVPLLTDDRAALKSARLHVLGKTPDGSP